MPAQSDDCRWRRRTRRRTLLAAAERERRKFAAKAGSTIRRRPTFGAAAVRVLVDVETGRVRSSYTQSTMSAASSIRHHARPGDRRGRAGIRRRPGGTCAYDAKGDPLVGSLADLPAARHRLSAHPLRDGGSLSVADQSARRKGAGEAGITSGRRRRRQRRRGGLEEDRVEPASCRCHPTGFRDLVRGGGEHAQTLSEREGGLRSGRVRGLLFSRL